MIGPNTYEVTCRRNRANCWEEAQKRCPGGFTQVDGADRSSYIVSGNAVIPAYKGEMIIQCNPR